MIIISCCIRTGEGRVGVCTVVLAFLADVAVAMGGEGEREYVMLGECQGFFPWTAACSMRWWNGRFALAVERIL